VSRDRGHLSLVVDEALSQARAARERRLHEAHAIKVAEEAPRTDLGMALKAIAEEVRTASFDVSYNDIVIDSMEKS